MTFQSEWNELRRWVNSGEFSRNAPKLVNQYLQRLVTVLADSSASPMDIAVLFRDSLRAAVANNLRNPKLPHNNRLPDSKVLNEQVGIFRSGKEAYLLDPQIPEHLLAAYRLDKRRYLSDATMDVSLSNRLNNSNLSSYLGKGQQTAVRATLLAEPGKTIIINLPTGCGKTMVIHALMAFSGQSKLTVVVVPTTALAIEQAQSAEHVLSRMNEGHGGSYCWHAGLAEDQKQDIKEKVIAGTQRVLFCSPEAVYRGLLHPLRQAAGNGVLENFIVDEAHLIEQWGADFRPEFQVLSAVLARLNKEGNFKIKKVFMSATFQKSTIKLIDDLFTPKDQECLQIHASFLRPEPRYSAKECANAVEHKLETIKELLDLPRPLIVYCTTREEVDQWEGEVRDLGFSRSASFDGRTLIDKRESIIEQWSKDQLDIIIATKAFGVGMDKADIRSMLRVSVPENIDLFYQEAGRTGRDGLASRVSLIYSRSQRRIAEGLNRRQIIGNRKGLRRWRTMWNKKEPLDQGRYLIDLSKKPTNVEIDSEANWGWNWKTLLLMQRAGLISTELDLEESEFNFHGQEAFHSDGPLGLMRKIARKIIIKPLLDGHTRESVWEDLITPQRNQERLIQRDGQEKLFHWLDACNSCFCDVLMDFYTISEMEPEYACGGCPGCDALGEEDSKITLGGHVCTIGLGDLNHAQGLGKNKVLQVYFDGSDGPEKWLAENHQWIQREIQRCSIYAVRADLKWLDMLASCFPRGFRSFWVSELPTDQSVLQLVTLGLAFRSDTAPTKTLESTKQGVRMGEISIMSDIHTHRKWFELDSNSYSLPSFLASIEFY